MTYDSEPEKQDYIESHSGKLLQLEFSEEKCEHAELHRHNKEKHWVY